MFHRSIRSAILMGSAAFCAIATGDICRAASLIIPSESLWRRATFEMQSPLTSSFFGSPFTSTSVPSLLMVAYAFLYLCFALFIAVRVFQKRDL